ncbi:ecto-ADP-ribosyltransferase 4-like [Cheilinus undulatus]|uniref:ecto-ADP-ribosyltransferase 4-like n=1 Tax=Cheilinus undulatus TaxID=241271 RepID=UPI001BD69F86|nr:ecto-ADP-ribosyltransferase 4-like [Cheilinus undulatus]
MRSSSMTQQRVKHRCLMTSGERRTACRRVFLIACTCISLLLMGLLIFVAIFVTLRSQDVAEQGSLQHQIHDVNCSAEVTDIPTGALMQKWSTSGSFSRAWSEAEKNAKAPAHRSMTKTLSTAIYMYTSGMIQADKQDSGRADRNGEQESLESFLHDAVDILNYHQKTSCLSTSYRTDADLDPDISSKAIHFSTFTVGSDWRKSTGNTYCFEFETCFGANITHYSALKGFDQALIPPYEVFKITDIKTDTQGCKVSFKMESMGCVYNSQSEVVHSLSHSSQRLVQSLQALWFCCLVCYQLSTW